MFQTKGGTPFFRGWFSGKLYRGKSITNASLQTGSYISCCLVLFHHSIQPHAFSTFFFSPQSPQFGNHVTVSYNNYSDCLRNIPVIIIHIVSNCDNFFLISFLWMYISYAQIFVHANISNFLDWVLHWFTVSVCMSMNMTTLSWLYIG